MRLKSDQVVYVREYNSEHEGSLASIPISDMVKLPLDIGDIKETKIYRCYNGAQQLLGEIRPHGVEQIFKIEIK